jgi:membrane protein
MSERAPVRTFLQEFYHIWLTERPGQFAASLAYYALFSFVPATYIAITIAGIFVNEVQLTERILAQVANTLGPDAALALQGAVANVAENAGGSTALASVIGFIALLFAASLMFFQLQFALNTIWKVPPATRGETADYVRNRLLAFVMVFAAGLLLVLVSIVSVLLSFLSSFFQRDITLPFSGFATFVLLGTLCLALIYKILPSARIAWRDVWVGSAVTALLIGIGGSLLGVYLGLSNFDSALGAAGAVAVFLIAFYFVGQIFVFGAVFTRVYASIFGSKIVPRVDADAEGSQE